MKGEPTYETWRTSSLPLAAFVVTRGELEFLQVDASDPTNAEFIFHDPEGKGRSLAKEFSQGGGIPAIHYHAHFRRLRGLMQSALKIARSRPIEQTSNKVRVNNVSSFANQG